MAMVFKQRIPRYVDANGKRVPKGTPGARKVTQKSATRYGRWTDPEGAEHGEARCSDMQAGQALRAEKVQRGECGAAGLAVPYEELLQPR
jgi:hypothetical protein